MQLIAKISKHNIFIKVAISTARFTNKQLLAGKVALKIHFPGWIASALVRVRIGRSRLGLDVLG